MSEVREVMKKIKAEKEAKRKASIALMPPTSLFVYTETPDADGVIARFMPPTKGVLELGIVRVDEFVGDSVQMTLQVEDEEFNFFAYKVANPEEIDIAVKAGSKIKLLTSNPAASGYWVAFSWRSGK